MNNLDDLKERGKLAKEDGDIIALSLCIAELSYIKKENYINISRNMWGVSSSEIEILKFIGNSEFINKLKDSGINEIEQLYAMAKTGHNPSHSTSENTQQSKKSSEIKGTIKQRRIKGECLRMVIDNNFDGAVKKWNNEFPKMSIKPLEDLMLRVKAELAFDKFHVLCLDTMPKDVIDAICNVAIDKQKNSENKIVIREWCNDIYRWRGFI